MRALAGRARRPGKAASACRFSRRAPASGLTAQVACRGPPAKTPQNEKEIAKAGGRLRGKQPKLTALQEAHLVELHRAGEHTSAELAELFGVARSTVYRAIQRDQHHKYTPTQADRSS
jgi:DNA-directed RNA polymerase specialized sigma24 family protein